MFLYNQIYLCIIQSKQIWQKTLDNQSKCRLYYKKNASKDVKKIYDGVISVKPDKIYEYYNKNCKRFVVEVNDGEIKFYKSTGDSRSTGLKDIWLPFDDCVFDLPKYVVSKPEEKFIIDFELKGMSSELLKDNFDDLNTYKRFINERTASYE